MESKRTNVNGENVVECVLSVNELKMIYNALIRLWCNLVENRVNAIESSSEEFYYEQCGKLETLIYEVYDIINP